MFDTNFKVTSTTQRQDKTNKLYITKTLKARVYYFYYHHYDNDQNSNILLSKKKPAQICP